MRRSLIAALLVPAQLCSIALFSQSVTLKESPVEKDDYLHELFRPIPGRYVAINYGGPHGTISYNRDTKNAEVTGLDANLNQVYTTPIKELSGNKYQGAIDIDKTLHIFYSDNQKIFRCELDAKDGHVTGSPAAVFTASNEPYAFIKGFSPDSSHCYAVFKCAPQKEKDEIFEGVVLDRKMNVVTNFSFRLEKVKDYIDNTSCILSPEGLLFIVNNIRVKSSKSDFRPYQYMVTEISKEGKTVTTLMDNVPAGRIDNLYWKPAKSGLSFAGLFSNKEKEGYTSIISGEFNSWQKKATNIKQTALNDAPYWQHATGKYLQEIKSSGIPSTVKTVNSFEGEDGSITMVLQSTEITYTTRGSFSYSDSYTGGVYIIKLNANNQLEWAQVVPLGQREPFDPLYSGVIAAQPNGKDLFLFFHDKDKNANAGQDDNISNVMLTMKWRSDNQLVLVKIKENGSLTRTVAGQESDNDFHLAPRLPYTIYGNEIIYTSYHFRDLGKSRYKQAVIRIK